jgi:hypothetical protein
MKIYDITGIGANLTGSFSGSFKEIFTGTATTASYVQYSNVANKPTLVSGSSQITYSGISSKPAGIVSGSSQVAAFGYATTGSNQFKASQAITGSLTVTGDIVAQTLNVQQVTSSIVFSSGSNRFGNNSGNTHRFTGSVNITGSLTVNGIATSGTVSGTTNYIGKFTGTNTIGNSQIFDNGSNVGIGTALPSAGLEIETDGSVKTALRVTSNQAFNASPVTAIMFRYRISSGTTIGGAVINAAKDNATESNQAGNLQFWTNNGTTLAERMRITSGGNVGIGATPSAWNTTSRALQLTSFVSLSQQHSGALNLMSYAIESSANSFTYGDTGVYPTRLNMNPNDGIITFSNAGTGTAGNAITFTPRLTILNNGNVGIGTNSPSGRLHILDSAIFRMANDYVANTYEAVFSESNTGGSNVYPFDSNGNLVIQPRTSTGAARDIVFATGANTPSTRMSITSGGIVSINGGLTTYHQVSIKSNSTQTYGGLAVYPTSGDRFINVQHTGAQGFIEVDFAGSSGFSDLVFRTGGNPRMTITSGGNVLIGTTSNIESSKLRVSGNLQIDGFQRMYTYYIVVGPSSTGTITISSPTGTNMQGSMQVMAGGYGNGITGNVTGLWMVGGLLFFNNASTSTITQIVNSVTDFGSMSFQRSSDQYTVSLTNTASNPTGTKTFYVSVIINGD